MKRSRAFVGGKGKEQFEPFSSLTAAVDCKLRHFPYFEERWILCCWYDSVLTTPDQ